MAVSQRCKTQTSQNLHYKGHGDAVVSCMVSYLHPTSEVGGSNHGPCVCWFPLPTTLPVMIWPVQCLEDV